MIKNKKYILIIIFILLLIFIDQMSKMYMVQDNSEKIISKIIKFEVIESEDKIENNSSITFILTNLIIIGAIIRFIILQSDRLSNVQYIFLSFILAGGISNLIDKIIRGHVIEFIKIGTKLPSLNLADIYILVGWVSIVAIFTKHSYDQLQERKKNARKKS